MLPERSSFRIKICGITQPDQGIAIARLGATALGFVCVPTSPRYLPPEQIRIIVERLYGETGDRDPVERIGVFANAPLEVINQTVAIAGLTGVQLHGTESPAFCLQVRETLPDVELIKALRVRTPDSLTRAANYQDTVDTFLLDAYHPSLLGGTGQTLNWEPLSHFCPQQPWLLAGGLTPDNVIDAIRQAHPHGIDLSSGVEQAPGNKDLAKVRLLFERLQTWQQGVRV